MSRVAYVNGRYVPFALAQVHVEDRGYQFSDGVYEVIAVQGGLLIDAAPHFDRLERSLGEIALAAPMSRGALSHVLYETIRRNRVRDGMVYLQLSRGVARRDHAFPRDAKTAVVATARSLKPQAAELAAKGIKVITMPDIRWGRRDIKSISLLANVLAKQRAREAGAFEAWLVDEQGLVTEGSTTNAWIVDHAGHLVTRHLENAILSGVTRLVLLDFAREAGIAVVERPFSVPEAKAAPEAFLTSTTSFVLPIVRIDDSVIGGGEPGPITRLLRALYDQHLQPAAETNQHCAHAA